MTIGLLMLGTWTAYERLTEEAIELLRVRRYGRKSYRYIYGVSHRPDRPAEWNNQLVKIDARERSAIVWREEGCCVGEPVFSCCADVSFEDEWRCAVGRA